MRIYGYIRFSTDRQDDVEQRTAIAKYCESHRMEVDEFVTDSGVSGTVSWVDRNLYDLISKMERGDVLIVSELSRISRSMADFTMFLNNALRKIGGRLIVCNTGMDIDCSKMNAITEMILQTFMFSAQFEREIMVFRIKGALEYRKKLIKENGGFMSKAGNWCTNLGAQNRYQCVIGGRNASAKRRGKALESLGEDLLGVIIRMYKDGLTYDQIADALNNQGFKTVRGGKFFAMTVKRIIEMYERERENA